MIVKLRDILGTSYAQSILYHLIRAYSATFRLKIENESAWMNHLNNGGSVLICAFHQQFFSAIRYFKTYRNYRPGLMISRSRDGELIAGVARRTGWSIVRGSSSKGGADALTKMISHLKKNRFAAHVVDGPRGPAFKVKPGIIRLAHEADAMIVPFYVTADRAWYFKSWDKFFIPKPFAKVVLKYGDMIHFDTVSDRHEFELQLKTLENTMNKDSLRLQKRKVL